MEKLKRRYEYVISSSGEWHDTAEDILQGAAYETTSIKEEINALETVLEIEGIEGLKKKLSADFDKWKKIVLHIAVTGSSGAGKSAFINALRDVCADDEDLAKVGVTETTTELTPYTHPKNPNFIVWDMPGLGTPNFPKDKYIECVNFDRYDFFMILSKSRFTEEDLWLAKQIQQRKKRFYFIRTNIDIDIYNDSRTNKKAHSPKDVMLTIRRDCHKHLTDADIEAPLVFLIDSLDRKLYEFGNLENQLLQDADSLKVEAIALSLSVLTHDVLQKKKEVLEARIEKKAVEIACYIDNSDVLQKIFDTELSIYKIQFNLDEQTLRTNKDILSLSDENLKEFRKFFKVRSEEGATKLCTESSSFYGFGYRIIKWLMQLDLGYWLLVLTLERKWQKHSKEVFQFSCLALHQNLQEMYEMALNVYGFDAQKELVKSFVQLGSD